MTQRSAPQILDETFLEVRAKLLEIAAILDRLDRSLAEGSEGLDESDRTRRETLQQAIQILLEDDSGRSSRLQMLFSRPYEPNWREKMEL